MGSLDLTQKHSCFRSLVSTLMLLQRIYCNLICQWSVKSLFSCLNWWAACSVSLIEIFLVWIFLLYSQGNINVIDNDLILLDIVTCFYNLTIYSQSNLTCRMASESSTCAFSDSSDKLDSDSSKSDKDSTIIQAKVTVIRERKKVKVSTKFTIPHAQHVFLAMKSSEAFLQKTQDLSG